MIVRMMNRVRAALVVVACLVALTGCVKLDADLKVNSNETVSGTMQIGVDKQLLQSSGQSLDKVRERIEDGIKQTTTDGVTCKPFEDDRYVGSNCTFEGVPFAKMGSSSGEGVGFRKEGDRFKVTVKVPNLGNVPSGNQPTVNFKITMPGKIIEHDAGAKVDGRTATYDSLDKLGNVSLTSEAGGGFPTWAIILIAVLVLLAAAAVVFFVLRSRKAKAQQGYGPYGQYPGQPQQGQWGPQYGGPQGQYPGQPGYGPQGYAQPGPGGQYGGQPGQYGGQPGQPGPYGGQPGQPPYSGQPGQPQYPGQPQPQQGQPGQGQWGPQGQQPQQGQGGWGQQSGQPQPGHGQPGQAQWGPQQGRPPAPPQQGQPGGQDGSPGGWGHPPRDNDGQV
jgi:hypothetical protein